MSLLLLLFAAALAAFYCTVALRTLFPVLTAKGMRPLACNVCMSLWASVATVLMWKLGLDLVVVLVATAGASMLLLEWWESD